ncbi:hypothetical protein [Streptomyces sp. NPDC088785]|uniref:hypothetical protein n=1 Tax=Streptomyces sp. NPDC088785 TaxID=3365897 RepID=UPI0037F1C976
MEPEWSFRKSLSFPGRVENAWATALKETDQDGALARLREVLKSFEERPEQTATLWPSFQDSFLDDRFGPLLAPDDLGRLAALGELMARQGHIALHRSWIPLARAVLRRGTPDDRTWGTALLTRLYRAPQGDEEARDGAARALVEAGADSDAALDVYADLLGRHTPSGTVLDHVQRLLATDFDAPVARVERAAALAARLSTARPGALLTDRALGFAALLLHGRPADAVRHFEAACRAAPADPVAVHGLVAAHLQAGRHLQAREALAGRETGLTARVWQIVDLCRTLAWLDDDTLVTDAAQQPLDAARLAEIEEGPDTAPWVRYALGRRQLLEGRARPAGEALAAVAAAQPHRADLAYHAAWARLLDGRRREAADTLTALAATDTGISWPLFCLLLDADPDRAVPADTRERLAAGAGALAPVVHARLRMAQGRRPAADLPGWDRLDLTGCTLPHRIEALRTMLAAELGRGRPHEADRLLRLPLFHRLPRAEQRLWEGVAAQPADPHRAVRLLVEAHALGRDRAAQIRAAAELGAGNPAAVHSLLEGAVGRAAELLRARAEILLGDTLAAEQRLLGDAVRHMPRARYELGLIGLHRAAARWATGAADAARQEAERAAARLTDAALTGQDAVPPVPPQAHELGRAARLLAGRALDPGRGRSPWRAVRHRPPFARLLGLAQLLAEPERVEPVLVEALAEWTPRDEAPGLAAALARACALAPGPGPGPDPVPDADADAQVDAEVDVDAEPGVLLAELRRRHGLPAEPAWGDPLAVLTAAADALGAEGREAAVRVLRAQRAAGRTAGAAAPGAARAPDAVPDGPDTRPAGVVQDGPARQAAEFLAHVLEGGSDRGLPSADGLPGLAAPLLTARAAALADADLAGAATVLTQGLADHDPRDFAGLLDLGAVVPALCARVARAKRRDARADALTGIVRAQAAALLAGDDSAGAVGHSAAATLSSASPGGSPATGGGVSSVTGAAGSSVTGAAGSPVTGAGGSPVAGVSGSPATGFTTPPGTSRATPPGAGPATSPATRGTDVPGTGPAGSGAAGSAASLGTGSAGPVGAGPATSLGTGPAGPAAAGSATSSPPGSAGPAGAGSATSPGPGVATSPAPGSATSPPPGTPGPAAIKSATSPGPRTATPPAITPATPPTTTPTTTPTLHTLAHCAVALGDHVTADDLWQRILAGAAPQGPEREQYGAYLCHRAVTVHEAGDPVAAVDLLHQAARHLPADHPVHQRVTDLVRDGRMDALLAALFPDAVPDFERRGRYRAIEDAAEPYPALWRALERDDPTAILRELAALLDIGDPDDLALPHTLAVLHREEALAALARTGVPGPELTAATALWALLLAHPAFWTHARVSDETAATDLRRDLTDELLGLHRLHGARALDAGRPTDLAAHLRVLRAVRKGPQATRALLAGGPLARAVPDGVDPDLFDAAATRAGRLLDDWAADLVRTATERVDDPAAVEGLPVGVDRDYEAGITLLDTAIQHGFAPVPVLCAALDWHNQWQFGLYRLSDWEAVRAVLARAIPYAEQLAALATPRRPHLKENQVLGFHFLERGLLNGRNAEAVRFLEQAEEWDPANQEVGRFLASRRADLVFVPVREHNDAARYEEALALLGSIPDTEDNHGTHVQLRVNALYGMGKRELRERHFDSAERCLREVLVLAPEVTDDPKLVPDTNQALSALLNNRAVVFINAANAAADGDPDALLGLVAAKPLLREALDLHPANTTAGENLTRAEEMIRRFLR